ncbi:hypothetical protein [Nocardia sp. NPDC049149]|uniref:hypothetical protein n=1 Tax=Nocardia sp. NPDC049149 TaxID=3364315 RepID=UPI00371311D0
MSEQPKHDLAEYEAALAVQTEEMRAGMSPQDRAYLDAILPVLEASRGQMEADKAAFAARVSQRVGPHRDAWAQVLATAADTEGGAPV